MHVLNLGELSDDGFESELRQDLEMAREQPGKTYQMEFEHPDSSEKRSFVFRTTEKDLWLRFGLLPTSGHQNLAMVLLQHFERWQCQQLLVQSHRDGDVTLVTRTHDADQITFTMASAH